VSRDAVTSDAEFILTNTDRLITVTIRCVISFGAADGLNDFLLADKKDQHQEWRETVWCFQRDGLLMAALRAAILLDPHERVLSFAGINRRLGRPEVRAALLQALEDPAWARRHPTVTSRADRRISRGLQRN
jgi:hypothetical protein